MFDGFAEGWPELVVDLYATTMVMHNYADPPERGEAGVAVAQQFLQARLPWVRSILLKTRNGATPLEKNGRLLAGTIVDRKVREHGVWYAVDLAMNRDASLYLDTRNLREWARQHCWYRVISLTLERYRVTRQSADWARDT